MNHDSTAKVSSAALRLSDSLSDTELELQKVRGTLRTFLTVGDPEAVNTLDPEDLMCFLELLDDQLERVEAGIKAAIVEVESGGEGAT